MSTYVDNIYAPLCQYIILSTNVGFVGLFRNGWKWSMVLSLAMHISLLHFIVYTFRFVFPRPDQGTGYPRKVYQMVKAHHVIEIFTPYVHIQITPLYLIPPPSHSPYVDMKNINSLPPLP